MNITAAKESPLFYVLRSFVYIAFSKQELVFGVKPKQFSG